MTQDQKNDANLDNNQQPVFNLVGQYLKDLSFECPKPGNNVKEGQSNAEISVGLMTKKLDEHHFEVSLKLDATAKDESNETLFIAESNYCGVFILDNIAEEQAEFLLGVEAPQLLFPFARRILMTTITDAGFKSIFIDPINFGALFMQAKTQKPQPPAEKKKIEKK